MKHLCTDEALFKIGVDASGGLRCCRLPPDFPRPHLLLASGEEGDLLEQAVAGADDPCQAGFGDAQLCHEKWCILIVHLGKLGLDLRTDWDDLHAFCLRPLPELLLKRPWILESFLRNVGDVEVGLAREQVEVADGRPLLLFQLDGPGELAVAEVREQFFAGGEFHLVALAHLALTRGFLQSPLHLLQIRERQFGVDDLDVSKRIGLACDMDHLVVLKAADHMRKRLHLPDVPKKLVPESFAPAGSGDQAGDVHHLKRCRHDAIRFDQFDDAGQPRVPNGHYTHVRVNGAKRVVRHFRLHFCEGAEEGGLANVGQPDDSDFKRHRT